MSVYNLEAEAGRQYNYKIEGDTIAVSQYDVGSMIFLRVEKHDVTPEEIEAFKKSMESASGNINIVILPPWVGKMRITQAVEQTPGGNVRRCPCGGTMRQTGVGSGFMCFKCGNETAPSTRGGEGIDVGRMP